MIRYGLSKPKLPVKFFRTSEGREVVREWLRALPAQERKAIGDDIRTVQFGWPVGMPLVRKIEAGLWEVRVDLPGGKAMTMARKKAHRHVGSDFEEFLREDKRLEAATALALKRVIAWQFQQAMEKANVSQAEMARRMHTSRAVIRRLLDADDPSITLSTISKAANALGKNLRLKLAT